MLVVGGCRVHKSDPDTMFFLLSQENVLGMELVE